MEKLDEGRFRELIVESQDLNADAMRVAAEPLDEIVERGKERRSSSRLLAESREQALEQRHDGRNLALAAGAAIAGTAALGAFAQSAAAADNVDVMAMQTAASLENLAVATYGTALTLPYIKNGNAVVKAFAMTTMQQHHEHGAAFNAKVTALGGKAQTNPNPKYAPIVQSMVPKLQAGGPLDVVKLAALLENIATSTYVKNIQLVTDPQVRLLFGTIAGVESMHLATLLAVQALLENNLASEIALPPSLAGLPTMTADLAIPETFKATTVASPPAEGAVQ